MAEACILKKAISLLDQNDTLSLAVIDEMGYPKIYAMEKVLSFYFVP